MPSLFTCTSTHDLNSLTIHLYTIVRTSTAHSKTFAVKWLAIRQAVNGSGKLGSSHAKEADAKDPNAALINTDVIGTVEQNILPDDEVPTKPPYLVLEDSIMLAPEPNLASAELSTLNRRFQITR